MCFDHSQRCLECATTLWPPTSSPPVCGSLSNKAWSKFSTEPWIELVRPAMPQGWLFYNFELTKIGSYPGSTSVPLKRYALTLSRTDRSDVFLKHKAAALQAKSKQGMKAVWVQTCSPKISQEITLYREVIRSDHEKALLRRFLRKPLSLWRTAAQPLRQDHWYFLSEFETGAVKTHWLQ